MIMKGVGRVERFTNFPISAKMGWVYGLLFEAATSQEAFVARNVEMRRLFSR